MKRATRDYHPARRVADAATKDSAQQHAIEIPAEGKDVVVRIGDREIKLTNLNKVFWPELGLTKRDLRCVNDLTDVYVHAHAYVYGHETAALRCAGLQVRRDPDEPLCARSPLCRLVPRTRERERERTHPFHP